VAACEREKMTEPSTTAPVPAPPEQQTADTSVWAHLGPSLITGAADDDPSGITTYSQVEVQFGFPRLWTMLLSFPLMAAIQEICGRLGRITGAGVAANLKKIARA
jgi:Mn2+/Fe2+ NRAMP family transporter